MTKYLIFAWESFEAHGGFEDFAGIEETIADAKHEIESIDDFFIDNAQIVNRDNLRVVSFGYNEMTIDSDGNVTRKWRWEDL